jgi:hypothetical protein
MYERTALWVMKDGGKVAVCVIPKLLISEYISILTKAYNQYEELIANTPIIYGSIASYQLKKEIDKVLKTQSTILEWIETFKEELRFRDNLENNT